MPLVGSVGSDLCDGVVDTNAHAIDGRFAHVLLGLKGES